MLFQELGDRVFRRRYESLDQNIGVVIGTESVCLIDSRCYDPDPDQLRHDLATLTNLPVRYLINTHMHWDHTFGNDRFPESTIVGHDRCRSSLIENGEATRLRLLTAEWMPDDVRPHYRTYQIVPPTVTFDQAITLHLDDRRIDLAWLGRAHTDNDVTITVDDVCFVGDMIEEGAPPVFQDSYPSEWVVTLDRVLAANPPTVVPGHGDVVDTDFVRHQRDQISQAVAHLTTGEGSAPWSEAVMASIAARLSAGTD
ncbi:MAG TPA: MBL fold metallo-hydrolase [Acidimicrobiia bacterium]|nr:MBL fold metallo-hydrolase [Acidimicrobiia bacterium]